MNLEDLEELLEDFLPSGFRVSANKKGELIVYTSLRQEDDGELVDIRDQSSIEEDDEELEFNHIDNGDDFDHISDEIGRAHV